jgi:hypothetical protein
LCFAVVVVANVFVELVLILEIDSSSFALGLLGLGFSLSGDDRNLGNFVWGL